MANVKFLTGNIESLPANIEEGKVYFAITDADGKKGKIIFDKDSTHRYLMAASPSATAAFALCETASSTVEKEILIQVNNDWILESGSSLFIKFSETNSASSPTFSIYDPSYNKIGNSIPVYYDTGRIIDDSVNMAGSSGKIIHYVYDGAAFWFVGWSKDDDTEYDVASYSKTGMVKPWISHTQVAIGPTPQETSKQITVNEISSVEGRYYGLEMDSNGRGFVNVPWTETSKNPYALKIGEYSYDGSQEVIIPTYNGDVNLPL